MAEPQETQDWVGEKFGGPPLKQKTDAFGQTRAQRQGAIDDLKRVDDPDAAQFRKDNPDADIYDFEDWKRQGGRWQGPAQPTPDQDFSGRVTRRSGRSMGR